MEEEKVQQQSKPAVFFAQYYYLFAAIIIVAILIVAFFWVLRPKYQMVKESGVFLATKYKTELESTYQYQALLSEMINNYRAIKQQEREALFDIIPKTSELSEILMTIDTLANNTNLTILAIDISGDVDELTKQSVATATGTLAQNKTVNLKLGTLPATQATKTSIDDPDLRFLDIAINFQGGNYEVLKLFLESLEQSRRLIDVVSLNFSSDLNNYTLNLRFYYLPEK